MQIGQTTYEVSRDPGADCAVLTGPRGGLIHAQETKGGPLWRLWRGPSQTACAWAVPDGPQGLRVLEDETAGLLARLAGRRQDLASRMKEYADAGQRDRFDLAMEMVKSQGLGEAPPGEQLRLSVELLLG